MRHPNPFLVPGSWHFMGGAAIDRKAEALARRDGTRKKTCPFLGLHEKGGNAYSPGKR